MSVKELFLSAQASAKIAKIVLRCLKIMTGWNFQQIIDADTGRVLSNPTIFSCYGQATSKGYGMPCPDTVC